MKSLRFVCWSAVLVSSTYMSVLVAAQSNPAAHVNQANSLLDAQELSTSVTTKPGLAVGVPIFGKPVTYDSGGNFVGALAVADVNGDGRPDVVAANGGSPTVSVLLGNGDGTLQSPVSYDLGVEATSVAIEDVNGDGRPDLILATYYEAGNSNSGGVAVLLGNGDGTFQAPVSYSSGGYEARSVAIADMNGDGRPDLIVGNQCQSSTECLGSYGSVGVLLGNGDGTFQAPVSYLTVGDMQWMAVADLNGDGAPDLVAAGQEQFVGVLLGNGDGAFQPVTPYNAGGAAGALAVADVNGDGKLDVITAVDCPNGCPTTALSVLSGNGDGTFQAPILTPTAALYFSIAIKDLDGDGKLDLVGQTGGHAEAMLGNGDGTFVQSEQKYRDSGLKLVVSGAIADLNGDGKPDMLMGGECSKCQNPNLNLLVLLNIFDAGSATAVTSSPNPSLVNQSVTFTATVTSDPPIPDSEVITFSSGKNNLGTGTIKNGVASLTTSFSKAGTHTVKASYAGDRFHKPSSGLVKQVVNH